MHSVKMVQEKERLLSPVKQARRPRVSHSETCYGQRALRHTELDPRSSEMILPAAVSNTARTLLRENRTDEKRIFSPDL